MITKLMLRRFSPQLFCANEWHAVRCSVVVLFLFMMCVSPLHAQEESLVNFAHLEHLGEDILLGSDSVRVIHVYANYPIYEWVAAAESGPEGIACVDDAGRAAVLYLHHFEMTGNGTSLLRAKQLLRFVIAMQSDDGQFYNFILSDHSINREGKTSHKSFGWWAARGIWAMGLGYRVLRQHDSTFAEELREGLDRAFAQVDSLLVRYDSVKQNGTYRIPQWLLHGSAADATSELMLGLAEYYSATENKRVENALERLAEGLMMMQDGDIKTHPFGLHRSWETTWHMWGNGQAQALALAGRLRQNERMILSAEREAREFYSRLLIDGFFKEFDLGQNGVRVEFEQIAYGVRPMAVGLIRLYEATGNEDYLILAGLSASWLFGNNAAGQPMYDPATGRCFDGIKDSLTVNKNSGAESTIEALLTILEVERYPAARRYLPAQRKERGMTESGPYAIFVNPAGDEVRVVLNLRSGSLHLDVDGKDQDSNVIRDKDGK